MKRPANELVLLFRSLADPSRLRILHLLLHTGELCVCDIEAILGFTQTKVSRHMSYLTRSGLTQDRKSGRWVLYDIAAPGTEERRTILEGIRGILSAHREMQKDIAAFESRVRKRCCATYVQVKPAVRRAHSLSH